MTEKPLIVVVPGGFCSPKAYSKLTAALEDKGYSTAVVELVSTGNLTGASPASPEWQKMKNTTTYDDVNSIHKVIEPHIQQGKEVFLVAHSYGTLPGIASCKGWTTVDRKAKDLPGGIKGFAYIAGFTHGQRGKNVLGSTEELPMMPFHVLNDDLLSLITSTTIPVFFNDFPEEKRQEAHEECILKYMARNAFRFYPEYIDTDVPVPRTWIFTEDDAVVSPEYQQLFIQGGQVERVIRIKGGHFSLLEDPEGAAKAVIEAAASS